MRIPRGEFERIFSRSSGPGGQSVNKLNSKATIKLERHKWQAAPWIPAQSMQRLSEHKFRYLTKTGSIIVSSDRTRSQATNLEDCFAKLTAAFAESEVKSAPPSEQAEKKWAQLEKQQQRRSEAAKKRHADKKSARKRVD